MHLILLFCYAALSYLALSSLYYSALHFPLVLTSSNFIFFVIFSLLVFFFCCPFFSSCPTLWSPNSSPYLTSFSSPSFEAVRLLFCSRKSSQPGPSAWLCTAPLIGSREIIPVEHDVLVWNSPQSNKITHTSFPISKLQTLYPLISSQIRHPGRSLSD